MQTYTVILINRDDPGALNQPYCGTYMTDAKAANPVDAVTTACESMRRDHFLTGEDEIGVIAVIEGSHNDVQPDLTGEQ